VASGVAGVGIILLALFPIALPIVVLTTVALVPLLIIGLVLALVIGVLAAPIVLLRRLLRHRRGAAASVVDHPVLDEELALPHPARLVVGERVRAVEGVRGDLDDRRNVKPAA
jgi:hypothetical protein